MFLRLFDDAKAGAKHLCFKLASHMLVELMLTYLEQGKRYSLPNSRIMIHQPLGGAQGQAAGKKTCIQFLNRKNPQFFFLGFFIRSTKSKWP